MKNYFLFLCLSFVFIVTTDHCTDLMGMSRAGRPGNLVKVQLMNGVEGVEISGEMLQWVIGKNRVQKVDNVYVRSDGRNIVLNQLNTRMREVNLESQDQILNVNGVAYRGSVKIVCHPERGLDVINILPLEVYLYSVIGSELSSKSDKELLKAQAIAARTFALYHMRKSSSQDFDLRIGAMAYKGTSTEYATTIQAVKETKGKVLVFRGKIFPAFFHTSCGGYTLKAEDVFGPDSLFSSSVKCLPCIKDSPDEWKYKISLKRLENLLGQHDVYVKDIRKIKLVRSERSKRVKIVVINGLEISAQKLRAALGANNLRSDLFWLKAGYKNVLFWGKGWGHGVGLCQYGAGALAKKGWNYKEILKFYYRGAKIRKDKG